jgi:hypothetical protein
MLVVCGGVNNTAVLRPGCELPPPPPGTHLLGGSVGPRTAPDSFERGKSLSSACNLDPGGKPPVVKYFDFDFELSQFCTGVCEERTWVGGRGIAIVGAVTRKRIVTDSEH